MRILLLMDPGIPVPPPLYGGHERLVSSFAEEYRRLGHEVTLLAGPGSYCTGETVTFGVNELNRPDLQRLKEILFVWKYLNRNRTKFDVIHNFGRLFYLLPVLNGNVKKIMTYGRKVTPSGIRAVNHLPNRNMIFTGCSNYLVGTGNVSGRWETVYNAIDFSQYQLNTGVDNNAPLMFLGRLDKIKGLHTAIKVAKITGNKLIIGGNISHTPDNYQYFKNEIEPLIDDEQIKYLGALNDTEKNIYLRQAKALLFPIEWNEPFGMVMVEAMACGTPVIAFDRGSVPEVINENVTGLIVNTLDEMVNAVNIITNIDRKNCRKHAYERFDVSKVAHDYLNL